MYNLRAIFAAFIQHWKTTTSSFWSLSFLVGILPQVAVFSLNNVKASISGASNAQLKVNAKLDISLSGASRLEYSGNPALGNVAVSGASTLKHR